MKSLSKNIHQNSGYGTLRRLTARVLMLNVCVILAFTFTAKGQTGCPLLSSTPTANENYIITYTPRVSGITSPATLPSETVCQVMQKIQYFDGLDRPIQTVETKANPLNNADIVTPVTYDGFGREVTTYLPYAATGTLGSLRTTAYADQSTYYSPGNTGVTGVVRTTMPYAQSLQEFSPLSRPLESGAPGTDWQPGAHSVKMVYTLNNNIAFSASNTVGSRQVVYYTATVNAAGSRTLNINSTYGDNELQVTITKDENWVAANGCLQTTEQYTDKEGHVVLKRTYNSSAGVTQMLSTYYVYDDFGLLCFVLTPQVNPDAGTTISQTNLDNLCYQYRYDERGRQVQKKIPGKGWDYTIYNVLDQPVATQDSMQRINNQWLFTKYDAIGRSVLTGIWNNGNVAITRAALQTVQSAITANLWETPTTTGNYYTNVAWPTSAIAATLNATYYDAYTNIPGKPAADSAPAGSSTMTRGSVVASEIAVLNTPANLLWTVNYYDDLGRNVQAYKQHYLGGVLNNNNYDAVTTTYDFTNAPTTTTRKHYNTASITTPLVTIANTYIYDNMGRKLKTWEQITNGSGTPGTRTLIARIDYNDIGQITGKDLHSTDSVNFLQNIAYAYNERGWLNKINDPTVLLTSNKLFAEQLNYNTTQYGATQQYNGNIAEMDYNAQSGGNLHVVYGYDNINRLTAGTSSANLSETGITYDANGNLKTLIRNISGTANSLNYTTYTGNQLMAITGYKAGSFSYDGNGNMLTDGTRGTTITYNLINLPQTVTATGISITYTYDAGGNKLRKVSSTLGTTDYIGGIQYKTNSTVIDFIQTEEGRAINTGSSWNYEYTLTDHLGNNRVTFDMLNGKTGEDDYYPFGVNFHRQQNGTNLYLYNKKELQSELNEYDYGARFYDPVIARWTVVDALAEKSRRFSPYNYVENNPIRNIDPDGMWTEDENGTHSDNPAEAQAYFKQIGGGKVKNKSDIKQHPETAKADATSRNGAKPNAYQLALHAGTILSAAEANKGYRVPPYKAGTSVSESKVSDEGGFARVYYEDENGENNMQGDWLLKAKDVEGLTAEQIKNKWSLPKLPNRIAGVRVNQGEMRIGEAAGSKEFDTDGGGMQYQLIGKNDVEYIDPKPLPGSPPIEELPTTLNGPTDEPIDPTQIDEFPDLIP